MPSSPLSPISDRDREYVDFALRKKSKAKPTLEWACAAARMSSKRLLEDGDIEPMLLDTGGDTEDEGETHEAITPSSSAGRDAKIWRSKSAALTQGSSDRLLTTPKATLNTRPTNKEKLPGTGAHADEMDAALALCGLGSSFSSGIKQ